MHLEKRLVSAVGIESAQKRRFKAFTEHRVAPKAVNSILNQQTDCKQIAARGLAQSRD